MTFIKTGDLSSASQYAGDWYSPNPVLLNPGNSANQLQFLRLVISQLYSPWKKIKPQVANEVMHFKKHFPITGLPLGVWDKGRREMWGIGQGIWLENSWVLDSLTWPFWTHVLQKISESTDDTAEAQDSFPHLDAQEDGEEDSVRRMVCSASWQVARVGWLAM